MFWYSTVHNQNKRQTIQCLNWQTSGASSSWPRNFALYSHGRYLSVF